MKKINEIQLTKKDRWMAGEAGELCQVVTVKYDVVVHFDLMSFK